LCGWAPTVPTRSTTSSSSTVLQFVRDSVCCGRRADRDPVVGVSRLFGPARGIYTVNSRYSPMSPTTTITARSTFGDNRRP
jgi:hypothetical protein